MVPKDAIQTVGAKSVVYVSTAPGRFMPHEVTVGETMGDHIAITSGVEPGDQVVTEGAFFVRAEHERLP
jgi:multidrug efflux pump subunit AcrA (membrane-fusion protein)